MIVSAAFLILVGLAILGGDIKAAAKTIAAAIARKHGA
jgi:hypothetical protein